MLAIRLPEEVERRLEKLAKRTGRTKTYYARQAILEHLDDLEDLYLAEHPNIARSTPAWPGRLNLLLKQSAN